MKIIDTHCHLDAAEFAGKRELLLKDAKGKGVCGYIVPGVTPRSWEKMAYFAKRFSGVHTAPGVHPLFTEGLVLADVIASLGSRLAAKEVVAIGEVGLDLYAGRDSLDQQLPFFTAQMELAISARLPLILHVRKAHDTVLSLLRKFHYDKKGCGGVVHAYGGSLQQAQHYYNMGFSLGIGGTICNPKARKIREIVTQMPLNAFVLETDAPYMRIMPDALGDVILSIAELREEETGNIAQVIERNTYKIFGKL